MKRKKIITYVTIMLPLVLFSLFPLYGIDGRTGCVEGKCGDGTGVFVYDDGAVYSGGFSGGKRTGHGIMSFPDGSEFSGEWVDDSRQGKGLSLTPDGGRFDGTFREDVPDGPGIYTFSDGRMKRVRFEKGKMIRLEDVPFDKNMGSGRYGTVTARGGLYTGWHRGNRIDGFIPHGRGSIKWEDGCFYSGEWDNGKMHGRGIMKWEDGSSYTGQWVQGRRSGFGTYTWKSGSRYMGGWKDNRKEGPGIAGYADGRIQKGFFRNDVFIGTRSPDSNIKRVETTNEHE